jgi:uncharacterized protein (DUF779 family)
MIYIMDTKRVIATEDTLALIEKLKTTNGPLMFHQSGGCCDGSSPMCFQLGEFMIGSSDVQMGEIGGCPFYMSTDQFEYWKHTQLIIDVSKGRGSSFSLEIPLGVRFLTRSRMFTDDELTELEIIT